MHDHHPAFPRTGATADLPAGTPAPEQDMGQTRALLLEMARCQSLDQIFRLVAETFAARQDVALCRIWLLEQTEPSLCASCPICSLDSTRGCTQVKYAFSSTWSRCPFSRFKLVHFDGQ